MAKVNITKPTGNSESLNLISAFKVENNTYVVLDSEKMGSMGLPIIYVCKYTNKLEKINDANEWQSVKNYLKGIISGTNFEYVKIGDNLTSDEAYYTPLTLPEASFNAIKTRYVVTESTSTDSTDAPTSAPFNAEVTPVMPSASTMSNVAVNVTPLEPAVASVEPTQTAPDANTESVMNLINEATNMNNNTFTMPNIANNSVPQASPQAPEVVPTPVEPVQPVQVAPTSVAPVEPPKVEEPKPVVTQVETKVEPEPSHIIANFENDKETFLKACENMFDALIAKYQKQLNDLEQREQELRKKEAEINTKMKDANEHLRNAEAKEAVANIAHDNAKRVMDLNNFMPVNPDNTGN